MHVVECISGNPHFCEKALLEHNFALVISNQCCPGKMLIILDCLEAIHGPLVLLVSRVVVTPVGNDFFRPDQITIRDFHK